VIASAASTGKYEGEGWRMRKDGIRFWVSVVVDTHYAEQGELLGFAKVTRDLNQTAGDRGATTSSAEDGGNRPAYRPRCPRLQQLTHRDPGNSALLASSFAGLATKVRSVLDSGMLP
jgi:hypothetical protein